MELTIKSMMSPDVEIDAWEAESPRDVYFLLELEIGETHRDAADLFQVMVATPEGLREHARGNIISERATLVLSEFSWPSLHRALQDILRKCQTTDWPQSCLRLQRYFRWEYEDFVRS
jgi:hypothetical protein